MAETRSLAVWTVATFDVVLFGLVLVLAGHWSGLLGTALPGLGTLPGVLVFGYLWGLVLVATRWAVPESGLHGLLAGGVPSLVRRAVYAGAFVGGAFVLGLVLVGVLGGLLAGNVLVLSGGELLGTAALVALVVAISALVGVLVGVVDALCYRAAVRLLRGDPG